MPPLASTDLLSTRPRRAPFAWCWLGLLFALLMLLAGARSAGAQIAEVGDGGPGPVKAPHLTAELTSLSPKIAIGGKLYVGLVLALEENWHVYWTNPGDSGGPPKINWTLPDGITAGPMQFGPPTRLPYGPLMAYGYEDGAAFPVELTASPSLKPGKVHLDAHVSWLVCAAVCVPGKAHLGLDLDAVPGPLPDPPKLGMLGQTLNNLAQPMHGVMTASAIGDGKAILLTLKTGSHEEDAEFYPFDDLLIKNAADQDIESLPDGVKIHLIRDPENPGPLPKTIHGLVKLSDTESYDVTAPITPGVVPEIAVANKANAPGSSTAVGVSIFGMLGLAFLGGLVLNLMPCVFPVLFLKGLSLVQGSAEERKRQRMHGIVYTLGILVSFWAVVAVLLALRAGGKQVGWGFQMQSPTFVAVLAILIFFLALSLAGQFELGLSLTSAGGELANKQGLTGSFFTGVLATVVATPCMGPLLGAAVGFALSQSAGLTFLIFTTLALGLALPYLLLTLQPQWTRLLPRPGAWMEILKQLTSVPLFITAVWLAWVYGQLFTGAAGEPQDGLNRMALLLLCFLVVAIAGWVMGRWPGKWSATAVAAVILIAAIVPAVRAPKAETLKWELWSPESFAQARDSGQPVFVDFTAAWCLSCKVNEAGVLRSAEVEKQLQSGKFKLLKADWTQYDARITQQLASVNRSGVPTYVIYPSGKNANPDVLPELLTKDAVLKAIEKDLKLGTTTAEVSGGAIR